ncbi:MAG: aldo/keto reductase [Alphaproteobacteria bacterium]|nr:aldo/keto reductase [Alphaproteobacteria bacterium]
MTVRRRTFLQGLGAASFAGATGLHAFSSDSAAAQSVKAPGTRPIPSTGEEMPLVGLGSWITFNVGNDPLLLDASAEVIASFLTGGGRMIDSSPMYGSAQSTIGYGLGKLNYPAAAFSADKIWTSSPSNGRAQLAKTQGLWGVKRMDLMQVHNLLAWEAHLKMLQDLKAAGEIRYVGITTSHGRRHRELEQIMRTQDIDFVQLTYNVFDREVEGRLLPLAREKGIGVIVNRPYRRGALIERFAGKPLPPIAGEIGAKSWAQILLKFVISHPAVTCAIPATTRVDHVKENLAAAVGPLPDAAMRKRIAETAANA